MEAKHSSRLVFVHDWLTGMRGGEKCLEVLCRRWPKAPLYTLLHRPGSVDSTIEARTIRTSFLQRLPEVHRYYRYLLPLMPAAAQWRLPDCDLVLSFSHCVAKSARPPRGVPHVCYCFTPMRYAWHMRQSYFAEDGPRTLKGKMLDRILTELQAWDKATAQRVTRFVAISRTVQRRIAECYGKDSDVIYPPVDVDFYTPAAVPRQDYYLVVSAFAPYKRLDLAIRACQRLGRKLVVIGTGQDEARLRSLAGSETQFLGWQPNEVIRDHLRQCQALLFPGEEDFGIVPLEAHACGAPVIAFSRGGATETVQPLGRRDPTGVWFDDQTEESLVEAMIQFERRSEEVSPQACRRQAVRFSAVRYEQEMSDFLRNVLAPTGPLPIRRAA